MRHVSAHRLADAAAGRLSPAELSRLESHVADCDRCRAAQERVRDSQRAMSEIAESDAPELSWDRIGAQIYWSTSRGDGKRARRRPVRWLAVGTAISASAVAAAVAVSFTRAPTEESTSTGDPIARSSSAGRGAAEAAPSQQIYGAVTFARGDARVGGDTLDMDRVVAAGDVLETGDGRVVVQFGDKSGFAVGPNSSLTVVEFTRDAIELDIEGMVGVDLTPRRAGQRFAIRAGEHRVVVRGTAFQVDHRDGKLDVQCSRGRVEVTDGDDSVDVSAGERFQVLTKAWREAALRAQRLSEEEESALDRSLQMALVPAFPGARAFLETSVVHAIDSEDGQKVAVDGLGMGSGAFSVRLTPGRHHFATMDSDGEWSSGRWIDATESKRTDLRVHTDAGASSARAARKKEMQRALRGRRARRCLDPLEKHGLVEGSYAVFEVGINEDGSQRFLNVVDSNLSPAIQHCLKSSIDAVQLDRGPRAQFRYRLAY